MIEFEEHNVIQTLAVAVICDKCGIRLHREENIWEYQEALRIAFSGGYASIFGDGSTFECDLCQRCVREVLGSFLRKIESGPELL